MPIEYDSKPAIWKRGDDEYELIWNVNTSILSVLTEDQIHDLINRLTEMVTLPPGQTDIYYFPVMRHRVTG